MPNTTLQLPVPAPLTTFAEDEILFRDNIRQFADDKLRPLVKEMDEKGVFDHDLIQQFFQLGLMALRFPNNMAGEAANSSKRFWPSKKCRGSMPLPGSSWMCRIRWSTTRSSAGPMKNRRSVTSREWPQTLAAPTRSVKPGQVRMPLRCKRAPNSRAATTSLTVANCGSQTRRKPASLFCSPPSIPQQDTAESPRSLSRSNFPVSQLARKKTSSESVRRPRAN